MAVAVAVGVFSLCPKAKNREVRNLFGMMIYGIGEYLQLLPTLSLMILRRFLLLGLLAAFRALQLGT